MTVSAEVNVSVFTDKQVIRQEEIGMSNRVSDCLRAQVAVFELIYPYCSCLSTNASDNIKVIAVRSYVMGEIAVIIFVNDTLLFAIFVKFHAAIAISAIQVSKHPYMPAGIYCYRKSGIFVSASIMHYSLGNGLLVA